jgi:hypothetical protein
MHSVANFNWKRPVHQEIDLKKKETLQRARKPLGDDPVKMNDTIHFGKYKGFKIRTLPTNYLEWLISITPDDTQALKYAKELSTRPKYK